jgi:rubrerythrin
LQFKKLSLSEKRPTSPIGKSNSLQESGKDLTQDIAKDVEKAIDILMKSEQNQEPTPYELTQEALRKKRKKQSQQLSR